MKSRAIKSSHGPKESQSHADSVSQQTTFSFRRDALMRETQEQEEDPHAAQSHLSLCVCVISLLADPLAWTDVLRRACSVLYLAAILSPFYLKERER